MVESLHILGMDRLSNFGDLPMGGDRLIRWNIPPYHIFTKVILSLEGPHFCGAIFVGGIL